MVTKYDIFNVLYKNEQLKPTEIIDKLNKSKEDYKNVYRLLKELEKEGLVSSKESFFTIKKKQRTKELYEIINYCLKNNINYNLLIDKNLIKFISEYLSKGKLNKKTSKLNPRTFKKYIEILDKYELILIKSRKPFEAIIFFNNLINNLLVYFKLGNINVKKIDFDYFNEIKKELSLFYKLKKKNELGFRKIVEEFEVSFVHHSLSLEGNPITLPDTIKILKDKIIPGDLKSEDVDELKNYENAILQMLKDSQEKKQLLFDSILNYHSLSMAHKKEIAGKIRSIEVHIKGNPNFKVSKVKDIQSDLEKLFIEYNNFIKNKNNINSIVKFASYFHNEFQHIHPFIDGNSRITRLITFHILNSSSIPILDIPLGLLDEYLDQTKGSRIRNDELFQKSLGKIILFNLKKINIRLR